MSKPARKFEVDINERAFFYEPWLLELATNNSWRYDNIPPRIALAFAGNPA